MENKNSSNNPRKLDTGKNQQTIPDKKEATDADKQEDLSILLRQLYRLTYEAIQNDENGQVLQDKYTKIIAQYETIVNKSAISKESTSPKTLINILEKLISHASSKNEFIYGKKTDFKKQSDGQQKEKNPNDPNILLLNYCTDDNIDQSILVLLKYKLNNANKSCLELCHYIQKSSGWAYCNQTAVAAVMNQINQSAWKYENNEIIQKKFPKDKKDENAKKKYISNIIVNKYQRRLLLLEIFLREKTSTSKVMYASGGYHTQIRNDSIFQMALSMDNMDVYELIFKYGVDVEGIIDNPCTTNNSTNKSSAYTMYKPIHKAVENANYTLVELLIKRGANIKDYRTEFYLDDYNISKRDRQETLLYLAATRLKDDNKMFKLILNTYKQEINGLPDVNKINMFVVTESKPKDVYDKELAAIKARIKADKAARGETEEDDDERWGAWNNRRSEYFLQDSEHVYHYETLIHVAVRECNIEMIKYLLIYGVCIDDIYKIKTMISLRNSFHQQYSGRSGQKYTEKERAKLMKEFHDNFVEKYKKSKQLGMYECVLSVYDILENVKCDDNKKIEIKTLLQSEKRWFPELMDYYPNNMGKLLYIVGDVWCKNIPKAVTNLIIKYFYTLFTDE
eukprot:555596_1